MSVERNSKESKNETLQLTFKNGKKVIINYKNSNFEKLNITQAECLHQLTEFALAHDYYQLNTGAYSTNYDLNCTIGAIEKPQ